MGESADDINRRWLSMVHGHWAGRVANETDSDLLWDADIIIDLSSADEALDHTSDGEALHVLRRDDGAHCAFAIKFDPAGNVAFEDGRRRGNIIFANDDELVAIAHGGKVRGITSYEFYPDLKDLSARLADLSQQAKAIGYVANRDPDGGSVANLTERLAALENFTAAAITDPDKSEKAFALLSALGDFGADLAPARRQETVRALLLKSLHSAVSVVPPLVDPKAAAILERQITDQNPASGGPQTGPAPRL